MKKTTTSLLVFAALALSPACASTYEYARGTASYSSSDRSGAVPLSPIVCIASKGVAGVALGRRCMLRGRTSGDTTTLESAGPCLLPTGGPLLSLKVEKAQMTVVRSDTHVGRGDRVDVTLSGAGDDGKPLSYTFTGTLDQDAPSDRCAEVLGG